MHVIKLSLCGNRSYSFKTKDQDVVYVHNALCIVVARDVWHIISTEIAKCNVL